MADTPFSISILSGKGGVGKTTICLNLARRLSQYHPVWLVDIDLFNRGTTSAVWESEKEIPLSVAELILETTGGPEGASDAQLYKVQPGGLAERLQSCQKDLTYTHQLFVLPAARAEEGRDASFLLWRGMNQRGLRAEDFLVDLLAAFQAVSPGAIVLLDGHGGLDDLSIGAAVVSDVTYIVNEPDLITFTGSITLYHEIARTCEAYQAEPRVEFIVNRVPPNKSLLEMERDFGDVLRTISPVKEPVAAYFPLEPELFGVFGDDPFVSEIYTEFWFSKKIQLIARNLIEHGARLGRLKSGTGPNPKQTLKEDAVIRTTLRREFHKRGDRLLIAWLGLLVLGLAAVFQALLRGSLSTGFENLSFLPGFWTSAGLGLAFLALADQTRRWLRVQRIHVRNARRVRATRGRRLRLGDSESARLREVLEAKSKEKAVRRGLRWAVATTAVMGVIAALLIPNFLDTLQEAKQRRTVADIRNTGTAMFSWLVDQVATARSIPSSKFSYIALAQDPKNKSYNVENVPKITLEELSKILVPTYIQEVPALDSWGHPYEYRLNAKNPLAEHVMVIRSPGRDGQFQGHTYSMSSYPPTEYERDMVWADGEFFQWPGVMRTDSPAAQKPGLGTPWRRSQQLAWSRTSFLQE